MSEIEEQHNRDESRNTFLLNCKNHKKILVIKSKGHKMKRLMK